jgi:hypothetical protein
VNVPSDTDQNTNRAAQERDHEAKMFADFSPDRQRNPKLNHKVTARARYLAFECRAEKISVAPDQAALAHGAKPIEGNPKCERQDTELSA